jgi:phage/plasmid-associated DNA primase
MNTFKQSDKAVGSSHIIEPQQSNNNTALYLSPKLQQLELGEARYTEPHFAEWMEGSGVNFELTLLNLQSLDDKDEIARRLDWSAYHHAAGWFVAGISLDGGTYINGQLKPDGGAVIDGKSCKYLSTKTGATSPILLRVGADTWTAIATKYQVPIKDSDVNPEALDGGFWAWVGQHEQLPLIVAEGAKKAAAVLSQNVPSIGLFGVDNWGCDGKLDDLLGCLCPGRQVFLAYDSDVKTKSGVKAARERLTRAMELAGTSPLCLEWGEGKGIDDHLVLGGSVDQLIRDAITIQERLERHAALTSQLIVRAVTRNETLELALVKRLKPFYCTISNAFYEYTGAGYWRLVPDGEVLQLILKLLKNTAQEFVTKDGIVVEPTANYSIAKAKSCLEALRGDCRVDPPENNQLMCFKNGTVDAITGELGGHDKAHYLTWAIPYDYTPGLVDAPPLFSAFITKVMGIEGLEMMRAVTSMLLDPTAPYGKFAHFIGDSGSGKGVVCELLAGMFSDGSVKTLHRLADLDSPDKRYQYLSGTRLLLAPDMKGYQDKVTSFYSVVQNERLTGRRLHSSETIDKHWNVRAVVASTKVLGVEDSGEGWDRRVITIPFNRREGKQDYTLLSRLRTETGEIASWALGIDKERRNELIFGGMQTDLARELTWDAKIRGDSVKQFLDSCVRLSKDPGHPLFPDKIYAEYVIFCKEIGIKSHQLNNFKNFMKSAIKSEHYVKAVDTRKQGERLRTKVHFVGLELVPGVFVECENGVPGMDGKPSGMKPLDQLEFGNLIDFGYLDN